MRMTGRSRLDRQLEKGLDRARRYVHRVSRGTPPRARRRRHADAEVKRTSEFRAIVVRSFSNCSPEMPKHSQRVSKSSEYLSVGVYVSAHRGKNVPLDSL